MLLLLIKLRRELQRQRVKYGMAMERATVTVPCPHPVTLHGATTAVISAAGPRTIGRAFGSAASAEARRGPQPPGPRQQNSDESVSKKALRLRALRHIRIKGAPSPLLAAATVNQNSDAERTGADGAKTDNNVVVTVLTKSMSTGGAMQQKKATAIRDIPETTHTGGEEAANETEAVKQASTSTCHITAQPVASMVAAGHHSRPPTHSNSSHYRGHDHPRVLSTAFFPRTVISVKKQPANHNADDNTPSTAYPPSLGRQTPPAFDMDADMPSIAPGSGYAGSSAGSDLEVAARRLLRGKQQRHHSEEGESMMKDDASSAMRDSAIASSYSEFSGSRTNHKGVTKALPKGWRERIERKTKVQPPRMASDPFRTTKTESQSGDSEVERLAGTAASVLESKRMQKNTHVVCAHSGGEHHVRVDSLSDTSHAQCAALHHHATIHNGQQQPLTAMLNHGHERIHLAAARCGVADMPCEEFCCKDVECEDAFPEGCRVKRDQGRRSGVTERSSPHSQQQPPNSTKEEQCCDLHHHTPDHGLPSIVEPQESFCEEEKDKAMEGNDNGKSLKTTPDHFRNESETEIVSSKVEKSKIYKEEFDFEEGEDYSHDHHLGDRTIKVGEDGKNCIPDITSTLSSNLPKDSQTNFPQQGDNEIYNQTFSVDSQRKKAVHISSFVEDARGAAADNFPHRRHISAGDNFRHDDYFPFSSTSAQEQIQMQHIHLISSGKCWEDIPLLQEDSIRTTLQGNNSWEEIPSVPNNSWHSSLMQKRERKVSTSSNGNDGNASPPVPVPSLQWTFPSRRNNCVESKSGENSDSAPPLIHAQPAFPEVPEEENRWTPFNHPLSNMEETANCFPISSFQWEVQRSMAETQRIKNTSRKFIGKREKQLLTSNLPPPMSKEEAPKDNHPPMPSDNSRKEMLLSPICVDHEAYKEQTCSQPECLTSSEFFEIGCTTSGVEGGITSSHRRGKKSSRSLNIFRLKNECNSNGDVRVSGSGWDCEKSGNKFGSLSPLRISRKWKDRNNGFGSKSNMRPLTRKLLGGEGEQYHIPIHNSVSDHDSDRREPEYEAGIQVLAEASPVHTSSKTTVATARPEQESKSVYVESKETNTLSHARKRNVSASVANQARSAIENSLNDSRETHSTVIVSNGKASKPISTSHKESKSTQSTQSVAISNRSRSTVENNFNCPRRTPSTSIESNARAGYSTMPSLGNNVVSATLPVVAVDCKESQNNQQTIKSHNKSGNDRSDQCDNDTVSTLGVSTLGSLVTKGTNNEAATSSKRNKPMSSSVSTVTELSVIEKLRKENDCLRQKLESAYARTFKLENRCLRETTQGETVIMSSELSDDIAEENSFLASIENATHRTSFETLMEKHNKKYQNTNNIQLPVMANLINGVDFDNDSITTYSPSNNSVQNIYFEQGCGAVTPREFRSSCSRITSMGIQMKRVVRELNNERKCGTRPLDCFSACTKREAKDENMKYMAERKSNRSPMRARKTTRKNSQNH